MSVNSLPKIALTMGDASGIGPELLIKAIENPEFSQQAEFILYGEKSILEAAYQKFAQGLPQNKVGKLKLKITSNYLDFENLEIGKASAKCGLAAYEAVKVATLDSLAGKVDAIITAPMNKYSVNLANIEFSGHTEFIAELAKVKEFAMMQSSGKLHVAFVTTHIPIAEVAKNITVERIEKVANLLHLALLEEGVRSPKIAVMALNPHAGENGCMGDEDEKITKQAIINLRKSGMNVDDMIVPDVLFVGKNYEKYDGIISMYHDQGHIPFKMLAFDSGVNSTLGLPIIRCSPDHGSAFDIAWQNRADTGSFFAAITLALKRIKNR